MVIPFVLLFIGSMFVVIHSVIDRFPAPEMNPKSRSSSLVLSPDARAMVITEHSHLRGHSPSFSSLSLSGNSGNAPNTFPDLERKEDDMKQDVMSRHGNPRQWNLPTGPAKRFRSLSCSETSVIPKSKIMSPRLTSIPERPEIRPISDGIRRCSFDDPSPLTIPPSPKCSDFVVIKNSSISPHSDTVDEEDELQIEGIGSQSRKNGGEEQDVEMASDFEAILRLHTFDDVTMDD